MSGTEHSKENDEHIDKKRKLNGSHFTLCERPITELVDYATSPISIEVGPLAQTFYIDKNILSSNSEYFRLALQKEWVENATRKVKLTDIDPHIFNVYVNWLYGRRVMLGMGPEEHLRDDEPTSRIADAYILGDRLGDTDFQDAVADCMLNIHLLTDEDGITYSIDKLVRNRVYEMTKTNSKLRQLLVHASFFSSPSVDYGLEDHHQFLADFANFKLREAQDTPAEVGARCGFHKHKPGKENCYRIKYGAATPSTAIQE